MSLNDCSSSFKYKSRNSLCSAAVAGNGVLGGEIPIILVIPLAKGPAVLLVVAVELGGIRCVSNSP